MPGSRLVTVMAMLMLVVFVYQQQHIQHLQQKFVSDTRRGGSPLETQPDKTTFVILTGTSTVKDMLLENSDWLSRHITSPPEDTELLLTQGSQTELSRIIAERVRAINGTIIADERLHEKSFHVRTLTVEVPENISEFFLSVLRPLDVEHTASQRIVHTTSLKIMIIEKQ